MYKYKLLLNHLFLNSSLKVLIKCLCGRSWLRFHLKVNSVALIGVHICFGSGGNGGGRERRKDRHPIPTPLLQVGTVAQPVLPSFTAGYPWHIIPPGGYKREGRSVATEKTRRRESSLREGHDKSSSMKIKLLYD